MAENRMGEPEAVEVLEVVPPKTADIFTPLDSKHLTGFTYVFPAHSATVIEIKI